MSSSSRGYCSALATRRDLIGRDIAVFEGGECFRGPLKQITLDRHLVKFTCHKIAVRDEVAEANWRAPQTDNKSCSVQGTQPYSVKYDGTIEFALPYIGVAVIYPVGQNLDLARLPGIIQATTTD